MSSQVISKKTRKSKKENDSEIVEEIVVDSTTSIKESIDKNINNIKSNEKKNKIKVDFELKKKANFDKLFSYLTENQTINKRLYSFIKKFKDSIDNNCYGPEYIQNIINIIYNYKQIIGYLSYLKEIHDETDYEIGQFFNIPKNLINNNKKIFDMTKYELQKKNAILSDNSIEINNIKVEKTFPVLTNSKYIKDHITEKNLIDCINTVYITWILCIVHIYIYNKLITEIEDNEKDIIIEGLKKPVYLEKMLEKFISINNDTNVYIKLNIVNLKKKTQKNITSKSETETEKINNNTSPLENVDIHDEDDDDFKDDDDKKDVKSYNLKQIE